MRFGRILLAVAIVGALIGTTGTATAAQASTLSGTFAITPGACDASPTGSYFRMIVKTGTADGPFVTNNDSACGDKSYTLLTPGSDGGLIVGTYQPEPTPPFDGSFNSLADRITKPAKFFGVDFSTSTNGTDPQTKSTVPPPSLAAGSDGALSGDLSSFGASWNNQEFNQGAPKPDGSTPGLTAAPSGTLDGQSGAFTLEWRSQIVDGPFDGFTGVWHLEGTFIPDTTPTTAATAPPQNDQPNAASTSQQGESESGALNTTTSSSAALGSSSTTGAATSGSQAAAPPSAKSPGVVVARSSGGGSSGKGWVAVPAGLAALAVGGLAWRYRTLRRRETTL